MEDFIIREIDRIGEMMMVIAKRLGLLEGNPADYSLSVVKEEFDKTGLPVDLDAVLKHETPIRYLINEMRLSDQGLELLVDILFHSDIEESQKRSLLEDALTYLDGKGFYSFNLHSLRIG